MKWNVLALCMVSHFNSDNAADTGIDKGRDDKW